MPVGRDRFIAALFSILTSLASFGQQIEVDGGFVEDSLLIGQDVNYYLTASYPAELEMVFPDSGYNFSPFEYADKTYFPTQLLGGIAYDSTIYTVQSYEIDLVQYLQLPAIVLEGADSVVIQSPLDSIYLKELAPVVSDTTQLIANLEYKEVNTVFNYPLLYYILGAFVLLSAVLSLIFGKKIIRYFKLRKLRKDYERFSENLIGFIQKLKKEPNPELAEHALNAWKNYQERLDKYPFTKLTTTEILKLNSNKELEKPLKSIDRLIYGKRVTETVYQDFQQIEDFAQHRYQKKVEEIRYGK